jgi:hypothetical protein
MDLSAVDYSLESSVFVPGRIMQGGDGESCGTEQDMSVAMN